MSKKKKLDQQIALLKEQNKVVDKIGLDKATAEKEQEVKEQERIRIASEENPYKVFGRDFSVTEPKTVEYYKDRMRMMALKYKLVGRVNDNGQYIVKKDIKEDLVSMQKQIDEQGDDYYKVSSTYMKKQFIFDIKLTLQEDGKAKASLYLNEYVGKNTNDEYIYSHIADFVDNFDADFRIKLRKVFNLVDADAKNNDYYIPNLAVMMQDLFDIDMYIGGLFDMASQIYVIRMLKLLESGGEVEKEVVEKYKKMLAEYEKEGEESEKDESLEGEVKDKNKKDKSKNRGKKDKEDQDKNINTKHKEFLDKAIDSVGGMESLSVDKTEFDKIVGEMNKTDDAIRELTVAGVSEVNTVEVAGGSKEDKNNEVKEVKKPKKKKTADKGRSDPKPKAKKKEEKKKEENTKSPGVVYQASTITTENKKEENEKFSVDENDEQENPDNIDKKEQKKSDLRKEDQDSEEKPKESIENIEENSSEEQQKDLLDELEEEFEDCQQEQALESGTEEASKLDENYENYEKIEESENENA